MNFPSKNPLALPTIWLSYFLLLSFVLITCCQVEATDGDSKVISVGAIIDVNSRIGKEQLVAMELAAQSYNTTSNTYKLLLQFQLPTKDPFIPTSFG